MRWNPIRWAGPRELPEPVRQALITRFHLSRQSLQNLRLLEKWVNLSGPAGAATELRRVKGFKVFDPAMLKGTNLPDLRYDGLKNSEFRPAVQFKGHIEKDGTVHVADRRPPRVITRPINLDPAKGMSAPHLPQIQRE